MYCKIYPKTKLYFKIPTKKSVSSTGLYIICLWQTSTWGFIGLTDNCFACNLKKMYLQYKGSGMWNRQLIKKTAIITRRK